MLLRDSLLTRSNDAGGHHATHRFDIATHDQFVSPQRDRRTRSLVVLLGAGNLNRLYAVYTFAEKFLGVFFDLHGDVLPDPTAAGGLPLAMYAERPLPPPAPGATTSSSFEVEQPMFDFRGLQPFHDFPDGPDWWSTEMYKHVITQSSKMKMNFIGLHTYPYQAADAGFSTGHNEPTVWVGTRAELNQEGRIKVSYPTSYANTMRGEWGYKPIPTSNYSWGTAEIFEKDCWAGGPGGSDESCPYPRAEIAEKALFERTADMLQSAFALGSKLGVQSCVGTETPLTRPKVKVPRCSATKVLGCYAATSEAVLSVEHNTKGQRSSSSTTGSTGREDVVSDASSRPVEPVVLDEDPPTLCCLSWDLH